MQTALQYFLTAGIKLNDRIIFCDNALILFIKNKLNPSEPAVQSVD